MVVVVVVVAAAGWAKTRADPGLEASSRFVQTKKQLCYIELLGGVENK